MKWLLTLPTGVDLAELQSVLAAHGVTVDVESCIPLAEGEQVVEADGPVQLPAVLERTGNGNVKASPNSDLELYDSAEGDE